MTELPQVFWLFSIGAVLLLITGFYCLIMTYNLVRALIGLEILTKSVTLFIILAGYVTEPDGVGAGACHHTDNYRGGGNCGRGRNSFVRV